MLNLNHRKIRRDLLAFAASTLVSSIMVGCGSGNGNQRIAAVDESKLSQTTKAVGVSKGMQLVLLSNWPASSVSSLLNVFRSSPGLYKKGPANIEFGFAPYIYEPTQARYQNAEHLIDVLTNGGKNVTVTVHLAFQTPEKSSEADIKAHAADFNGFVSRNINKSNLTICVCPSLEDKGSNANFQQWTNDVAANINAGFLKRIYLRRSPIGADHAVPNDNRFRGVQVEYHGAINTQGDDYSNDGNLVYYPQAEESTSSLLGLNPSPQYPLLDSAPGKNDGFLSKTAGNRNTILLWRPAYNLLVRKTDNAGHVTFDPNGRNFANAYDSFDATEATVLKLFMGIP